MTPDTKYRKEVAALFPKLPPLTQRQCEYARTHRPRRQALYNKGEIWCPDCGRIIPRQIPRGHIADLKESFTCPCCSTRSTLVYSRKTRIRQLAYFSVIMLFESWQVVRHYQCHWHFDRDGSAPWFHIDEVVQSWITPDGKHEVFVARPRQALSCYQDSFQTDKPMTVRHPHGAYYIWAEIIYPHAQVFPLARRNGFCIPAACDALAPSELIRNLLRPDIYPHLEMLVKIKQYSLARHLATGYESFNSYAAQIRICHRNRYTVRDARLWCDYIRMLRRAGLDDHNPRYVCPRDLKKAHDDLNERLTRAERRRRELENLEKSRKDEANYKRDKSAFFGLAFGDDKIHISVFQTVADIAREGARMHHCVFAAGYHRRKDSLLLSACDSAGKHIETIEVDLKTFTVAQSRGSCNQNTPHHDHILRLMQRNMHLIRKAAATSEQSPKSSKQIPA